MIVRGLILQGPWMYNPSTNIRTNLYFSKSILVFSLFNATFFIFFERFLWFTPSFSCFFARFLLFLRLYFAYVAQKHYLCRMKLRLLTRLRLLSILQVNGLQSRFVHRKPDPTDECICKNCKTHFTGNFCPHCGQSRKTRRLSFKNLIEDGVGLITNLDSGMLRSATELFWRPGHMMRDYINGRRKGYMKPLSMLFCLGTLYYFVVWLFFKDALYTTPQIDFNNVDQPIDEKYKPYIQLLGEYGVQILNNPGLAELLLILPMVPAAWLCFRFTSFGKVFNFMEQFHIQVMVACQMLILTIVNSFVHWIVVGNIEFNNVVSNFLLNFFLLVWDYKQLYMIGRRRSLKLTALCFLVDGVFVILFFVLVIFLSVLFFTKFV